MKAMPQDVREMRKKILELKNEVKKLEAKMTSQFIINYQRGRLRLAKQRLVLWRLKHRPIIRKRLAKKCLAPTNTTY